MHHPDRFLVLTSLFVGFLVAAQPVLAQVGGSRAPAPTGNVPSGPQVPNANLAQPGNTGDMPQRGWFLSGKVALDDGNPPPESVTIQRNCNGTARPVAYTSSKGRFSFEVNQVSGIVPDASVGGGDTSGPDLANPHGSSTPAYGSYTPSSAAGPQLLGCELEAVLPGYRSDSIDLSSRRFLDNPDVGVIVLHRLLNVPGVSVSATSYDAPESAKKAFQKGLDAAKKQKWPDAQTQFEKAVQEYPKYAAAWFELGTSLDRQNQKPQAHDAYQHSIAADDHFLKPYFPLALIDFGQKKWKETADLTGALVHLDPVDYPSAFLVNAIANTMLGNLDVAEQSARTAIKLDGNHHLPRAEYVLGCILAEKHDYNAALPLMKSYIERAPNAPDSENIKKQISQIETLASAKPAAPPPQ